MKTYLIYGFGIALANFLVQLTLFILGLHSDTAKLGEAQSIGFVVGLAIVVIGIALGIKARRAGRPESTEFTYGSAVGAGVMISVFYSLLAVVANYVYFNVVNPHFIDLLTQVQIEKLEGKGLSGDQLDQAEKVMRFMLNPVPQAIVVLLSGIVTGAIISLIVAAFLKRSASTQVASV